MKKFFLIVLPAFFLLTGCVTSTLRMTPVADGAVASTGEPAAYAIEGMNSGIYLFYYIPVWSGNPHNPNTRDYDLFCDQVGRNYIYRMFDAANIRRRTAGVRDISVTSRSNGLWGLGIFWKRSVHGKGILVREVRKVEKKQRQI